MASHKIKDRVAASQRDSGVPDDKLSNKGIDLSGHSGSRIAAIMHHVLEEMEAMPASPLLALPFDPAILETMRSNPFLACKLESLRHRAEKEFFAVVDTIMIDLPAEGMDYSAVKFDSGAVSGRRLMIGSRRSELAGRSRRELAEAMAMEILLNLGNPDWDPVNPATSKETPSALLALLR